MLEPALDGSLDPISTDLQQPILTDIQQPILTDLLEPMTAELLEWMAVALLQRMRADLMTPAAAAMAATLRPPLGREGPSIRRDAFLLKKKCQALERTLRAPHCPPTKLHMHSDWIYLSVNLSRTDTSQRPQIPAQIERKINLEHLELHNSGRRTKLTKFSF